MCGLNILCIIYYYEMSNYDFYDCFHDCYSFPVIIIVCGIVGDTTDLHAKRNINVLGDPVCLRVIFSVMSLS